jgi:hypothetical protein
VNVGTIWLCVDDGGFCFYVLLSVNLFLRNHGGNP